LIRHYLDTLADVIRNNWDCPALTDYSTIKEGVGNDYTYGTMYVAIQRLCNYFQQLGLQPGDHIAICGASSANWAVAYLAVAAYKGVSVTMNPMQVADEIVNCIEFGDAKALLIDSDVWREIASKLSKPLLGVLSLDDFVSLNGKINLSDANRTYTPNVVSFDTGSIDDLAQISFTAGSTGAPKGVMLSFRSLSNNIHHLEVILPEGDRQNYVSTLPLSHAYGLLCDFLCLLPHINHIYYFKNCSIEDMVEAFNTYKPCYWMTIPLIFERMLPHLTQESLHACKQMFIGGALFNRQLEAQLRNEGVHLSVGYGMTEAGPLIGSSEYTIHRNGSVGKPVLGMQVRISSEGEILAKGANVMLGYYKDEQATREKIDQEGWLHTGDRGHVDEDGYLYVEGRMNQDMIVLPSGENIRPDNIEQLINALPDVEESLVLAREGKLIALVRKKVESTEEQAIAERNKLLAIINPQLPSFSQLFGVDFITEPLQRTAKQTLKRYLYT